MVERPMAFLLHGGPGGDHSGFKPAFSPLAERMQLVYVDHRGQGRSARGPKETYTLDNNVEDMEALRQHLGLEQVVVIGVSYGGHGGADVRLALPRERLPSDRGGDLAELPLPGPRQGDPGRARHRRAAAMGDILWAGAFESEEQLQQYYAVMGPLYSLKFDPVKAARAGRAASVPSRPSTRASAASCAPTTSRETPQDHGADAGDRRAPRLDLPAGPL